MANIKIVTISDRCMLCGLCEQPDVTDVFGYDLNGKLIVLHSGMVDLDTNPKVMSISELCPVKAIEISEPEINANDKASALDQFNKIVNKDLRDYPFCPPKYYKDYSYEVGKYQAIPVPAKYCSEGKYLTDESAENAGLTEFKRAVYSQSKMIEKQYLVAYKIKQLKKYYDYEETDDNFYFHINSDISKLLNKAYQLALIVTDWQIKLPEDFCEFKIIPDWEATHFGREKLQGLENRDIDLSRSCNFHSIVDYYRTWIKTDGAFKNCYYDFSEAEAELRDDIDRAVSDVIENVVSGDVDYLTNEYLKQAKKALLEKIEKLQVEVKKHVEASDSSQFTSKIFALCNEIRQTAPPKVCAPYPDNFDTDYNDDYRFFSERECIKAASNRRNRAYNEGLSFIRRVPRLINEQYMSALEKEMTKWKREILSIYDICGRAYPETTIRIHVGSSQIEISFSDFNDVEKPTDDSICNFIEKNYMDDACYGRIDGSAYISEYDCKIETNYDCDFKETLFGNIKETNKRYAYYLHLYDFLSSAWDVSQACKRMFDQTGFMNDYYAKIKNEFIEEVWGIC